MESIMRVGIDLSKHVFVFYGVDECERAMLKRTLKRNEVLSFFANLQRRLIGMEAGSGTHYWGRELNKLGHDVRIMDPRRVAPYRAPKDRRLRALDPLVLLKPIVQSQGRARSPAPR
jgi:transposase